MNKSLQSKLMKYSLTAAAVVAAGANANAQVQYSGQIDTNVTSSYDIDLNNDQVSDFIIHVSIVSTSYKYVSFRANKSSNEWIETSPKSAKIRRYWVKPLSTNFMVNQGSNKWGNHTYSSNIGFSYSGNSSSRFIGQGDKYIGVKLTLSDGIHYGWIRVNVPSYPNNLTVKDWAYEQTVDKGILTGAGQVPIQEVSTDDLNISYGPNPTGDFVKIKADDNYKVEILNTAGQIVKTAEMQNNKTEIDLSDLQAGLYIAKLSNDKITKTLKIVKE